MSKYIVFDASHISRIRYGKAKPSNPVEFSNKICSYILNRYKNPDDINNLMMIIGCKKSDLSNEKIFLKGLFYLNLKKIYLCVVICLWKIWLKI